MNRSFVNLKRYSISCLACLAVSVLTTSLASAQVNGSGVSSAALFDAVFNIPADPLPLANSVGGVIGETTQLNINNGGLIDQSISPVFNANSGTELNVFTGGELDVNLVAVDSEVNIDGGRTTNVDVTNSVVNFTNGGRSDRNFDAVNSEININAGSSLDFISVEDSVVNLNGGFFAGASTATNSTINISGGGISRFFLGEIFFLNGDSEINLIGSEFFLDGVPLSANRTPLAITDRGVILSGLLADGTSFNYEIDSDFNNEFFFTPDDGSTDIQLSPGSSITISVPEPSCLWLIAMVAVAGATNRRRN